MYPFAYKELDSLIEYLFSNLKVSLLDFPLVKISDRNSKYKKQEPFDFEPLLGEYIPSDKKIYLYVDGIMQTSTLLEENFSDLLSVVLIHELGHWFTHILKSVDKIESQEDCKDIGYNKMKSSEREWFAQVIVYLTLKGGNDRVFNVFEKLNENQSNIYKTWSNFKDKNLGFKDFKNILSLWRIKMINILGDLNEYESINGLSDIGIIS